MKDIKKFLKKLDLFGVNLNFKYQANDTYTTSLGGLFILLFGGVALGFGVYYFIPFIKRKNLNIIYYTMNIPSTEQIRFKESKAAFTIGFQCDEKNGINAEDLFNLESRFVIYTKDIHGKSNKKKETLTWHYCKYEDFYNNHNDSIDYLNLNTYQCLDDYDRTVEGIFSDQIFSYYEFAVTNKYKTEENHHKITDYLSENDCKLNIYYTDITIDLTNYKEPIKPFLDSIFIQLNPTLDIKRNVFFMNQYLFDDDFMFAVFSGDEKPKQIETLFSRYEEYALYMGLGYNPNNLEYAKVFIRADTKKTTIKRTYQKLTEFYADASSLLIALYEVLIIIFTYLNNFYAEQSVTKKLFFFKEIGLKPFSTTKNYSKLLEINSLIGTDDMKNLETINIDFNIDKKIKTATHAKIKNRIFFQRSKSITSSSNKELDEKINAEKFTNDNVRNKIKLLTIDNFDNFNNYDVINKRSQCLNSVSKLESYQIKSRRKLSLIESDSDNTKTQTLKINQPPIQYSFNVFEIFLITFCSKCVKGKLKLKNELNNKANDYLYSKLDIHVYLRNMYLFDIINQTIINGNKKNIINLLSRPLISINKKEKKEKKEEEIFYKEYEENNCDKFYEGIKELAKKQNKQKKEEKLLKLANKYIKDFL
jgi:hypothetical protein